MKKIICLMMVLLMAISALAGCQTKEKSSTPDEGSFEATQDEAVDVATQDEAVAVATPNEVAENDMECLIYPVTENIIVTFSCTPLNGDEDWDLTKGAIFASIQPGQ